MSGTATLPIQQLRSEILPSASSQKTKILWKTHRRKVTLDMVMNNTPVAERQQLRLE